jgi:hypothetical protein
LARAKGLPVQMMDGIFYTSVKGGGLAGAQEAHGRPFRGRPGLR